MKDPNRILHKIMEDEEKTVFETFNAVPGANTPDETAALVHCISVLKKADKNTIIGLLSDNPEFTELCKEIRR